MRAWERGSLVPRPLPDFYPRLQDKIWEWPGDEGLCVCICVCVLMYVQVCVHVSLEMRLVCVVCSHLCMCVCAFMQVRMCAGMCPSGL